MDKRQPYGPLGMYGSANYIQRIYIEKEDCFFVAKCNLGKVNLQCSPAAFGCRKLACTLGSSQGHFVRPICSSLLHLAA